MNYIWDVIINAKHQNKEISKINFMSAGDYSPYIELSQKELNFEEVANVIEVNPYYRFYEIFKDFFEPEYRKKDKEGKELDKSKLPMIEFRETLFDITIHFLSTIDLLQGMTKNEYYRKFILKDIKNGFYGEKIKINFNLLNLKEQQNIVELIYKMNIHGNSLHYFKQAVKNTFISANIYINKISKNSLILYLDTDKNIENEKKLEMLKILFLPLSFTVKDYWKNHFGVIQVEKTMKIGEISIY